MKYSNATVTAHLLRVAVRFLLLLVLGAIAFAQAKGSSVLYDQLNNQKLNSTDSDDFWDLPAFTSFAADDFVVPAGRTWTITEVHAQGAYAGSGQAESFNVAFYRDNGGLPGTQVYNATALYYFNNAGVFQIILNTPAVLGPGTYWVSVQAHLSINQSDAWWWTDRTVQTNSPAAWQNPNGGLQRCLTWGVRSTCLVFGDAGAPDQAFRLVGTVAATLVVTHAGDSGTGSLRLALMTASDGDTIRFDPSLNGQTITLTNGQLWVTKNVTISGPGPGQLSVSGNSVGRVFYINPGKTVTISGLTIQHGSSPASNRNGGGIYNDHANLTLNNCTISDNSADQSMGGGIYNNGFGDTSPATMTIINSTITGNWAWPGGGICNAGSPATAFMTITNSTISGNSDNGYNIGGGILNFGTLTIANSTLSGNSAYSGGAIYNWGGAMLTVTNSTFSGNFCSTGFNGHAGGILNEGGTANIGNTIFKAGPSGENIYNVQSLGPITSLGYNLSSDDGGNCLIGTGDRINTNPKLGPLQNNGGATFTHLPAPDSPAIDGSDPAVSTDQRGPGFARVVNGRADIGAVEVQATAIPAPTPIPSPTSTPTPTPPATSTATATATATATPAATATATAIPAATATPTAIPMPTVTASPAATPTATPALNSYLANISTRMRVDAGDNVLIAGFIIEGSANKRIILRGVGPSLAAFGVPEPLPDPTLELSSGGNPITANDNWLESPNAAEIVTTGLAPTNDKESALLVTLAPGAYTAILRGKDNGSGVGLVEVYDLSTDSPSKVINISTRGFVLTGQNVMIGGLIITGDAPAQLVVRAIGPSLDAFGVPNPLGDPLLELHDGNGATIVQNNNWRDLQEAALLNTGLAPSDNLESAVLTGLPPGNYTAIVKGADGGTGNGLVEVYRLSP